MEERRNTERGDALEERAELRIVGIEILNTGMELGPGKTQIFHRPLDLLDGAVAFERIDAGEANELLRVAAHDLGDSVIAQWLLAGGRLGVPGQEDSHDVLPGVVIGNLLDVAERDLLAEVLLDGGAIFPDGAIHKLGNGQMHVEVYRAGHRLASSPLLYYYSKGIAFLRENHM